MALTIRNDQREHLKLVRDQTPEVAVEICKLALDYLINGPNNKRYEICANKLNSTFDNVQSTIRALVNLLIETTKNNVSERDFETIQSMGFSPEHTSILWQFITSKREFVTNILKHYNVIDLRFRDLEWRLETKISSRCLLTQVVPIITIKLHLDSETINENKDTLLFSTHNYKQKTKREILFQIDPNNLIHIIDVLEQALEECKTHRTRNFVKAFNQE